MDLSEGARGEIGNLLDLLSNIFRNNDRINEAEFENLARQSDAKKALLYQLPVFQSHFDNYLGTRRP